MSKRRFIQAVVARSLPPLEKLPAAVQYGETLWEGLNRLGYGAEKGEHRESKDYLADLAERQRVWFFKFWKAFNLKKGRNMAAMRFGQLGDLDDAAYAHIVYAAGKEAERQLAPGISRKEAMGWLHERRFNDFAPAKSGGVTKEERLRLLRADLAHLEMLFNASRTDALAVQIEVLTLKIAEVVRS